jgi:receptor tyrosine kinase-like orphan receptor 1
MLFCVVALVVAQGHGQQMSEFLTIIVPSIVAPLTLALLVGIICICRMAKTKVNRPCKTPPVELNVLLRQPTITVTSSARLRDFPKSSVRLLQELTDGHYGKLYRAELLGYHGNGTVTRVIVKVLHDNAPPDLRQQFDSDLDHAADIRHPNVVCLLGVCRGSDVTRAPLALYEYVPHGDLRQFLLLHSPHCDLGPVMGGGQEEAGGMLSQADMLHISVQLASALDYLTAHGHVHTDVAARNVLVGDGLVVKVSELGLGRCQYPADYYCPRPGQAALPVRWMAPETLFHGHLTAESNVWSLGVLLWEVFTYGLQPYYGYANHEVIDMIGSHQILPCPDHASAAVYALMVDTWHELPTQRPTLPHLHAALQQLRTCSLLLVQPMSDSGHASHPSHPSLVSNMNEAAAAHYNRLSAPPSRDNFTPISQPVLVQDSHVSSSATSSASMTSQSDRSAAMWKVNGGQKHRHNQLITSPIDRRMTDV